MNTRSLTNLSSAVVLMMALATSLTSCGSASSDNAGAPSATQTGPEELDQAADRSTCTDEATPLDRPYGAAFPADWPFPPKTVVYAFEDRGSSGSVVTGITATSFQDVLDFMNQDVVSAGFEIESGETEEHDAEAEWRGADFHGRWAIRESGSCPGETVIQVLAGQN